MEVLQKWFPLWEQEEIIKIPLPLRPCADKWTWHFTKNGEFSVRNAYFVEIDGKKRDRASTSNGDENVVWMKLWKARAPTKIRNFGWKALHQGLPMRAVLHKRGCEIDKICPMCGEEDETVFHALVECPAVRCLWLLSPLRVDVRDDHKGTFFDWVMRISCNVWEDTWWDIFWSLLWGVWLRRNTWLFENRRIECVDVIERAERLVGEYADAMEVSNPPIHVDKAGLKVWKAPMEGVYKLNSDATIFNDGKVGFGGVIRDEVGDVMLATCGLKVGEMAADIAEACATRHSLKIAIEAGLRSLILESDCMKLVSHLSKGVQEHTSFGNIVADILWLGRFCTSLSFNHVCREGNRVAHTLAQLSKEYSEMRVWLEEVPYEALSFVNSDLITMNG